MCKLGDLLNEVKRPVKIEDHKEYQLVTVKRRNGGVVSRGNFKGKNILVKNYFVLKKNDYLISKRQVVHGANGIVPENMDGAVVSNEYLVSVGNESIKTDYLTIISQLPQMYKLFFLSSYGIDIEKLVFNVEDWKKRTMLVPNIDEQVKIASFFKIIDDTITLHQRKLEQLKELKKAYLQLMFPKKDETVPRVRFADFEDDWQLCKLGATFSIIMGQSPNSENYTENPDDYILVQGNSDMKNNKVVPRIWTTQVTKKAEKGDLILSVRAPVGEIGKTDYNVVLGRGVAAVKGNDFIFQQLRKMKDSGYWTRYSTGSTFESINSNDIKEALINIPNKDEQQKIGDLFTHLDDAIILNQNKLNQLKSLKKSYLQNMFI
ncbi:TPA: restriction endonuclease subunit S [Enterococcus faecalis]|nr:restriction endonuclease subunit S [Enterococcus faecalis]